MTEQQAIDLHAAAQDLHEHGSFEEALAGLIGAAAYFRDAGELADQAAREAVASLDAVADRLDEEAKMALLPRACINHGATLRERGRYAEARPVLEPAISPGEQFGGADAAQVALALNAFGMLCKYAGWFDEGEAAYRRALAIEEKRPRAHPRQLRRGSLRSRGNAE